MWRASFVALAAFIALSGTTALAEPTIDVGTFTLLPNTANQTITVAVTGGDSVTGFNLRAQMGDGSLPGVEPIFQTIDFTTGTLWNGHNTTVIGGPGPVVGAPSDAQVSVVLTNIGDSVQAVNGLVNLTISTAGLNSGSYPLLFTGTQIGLPSDFIGTSGVVIPAAITNGTINISPSPEPGAICLMALGGAGILLRRRRGA